MRALRAAAWVRGRAGLVGALALGALGCGGARPNAALATDGARAPRSNGGSADGAKAISPRFARLIADARADSDYIAVGPRALLDAIDPLLMHRGAQGHRVVRLAVEDLAAARQPNASVPEAIAEGIRAVASKAGPRLRYVLLVGDAAGMGEQEPRFASLPTFYLSKLEYQEVERSPVRWRGNAPLLRELARHAYASDLPYAYANRGAPGQPELARSKSPRPLAVGRVPVRTAEEAAGFARKAIGYDKASAEGTWRRRLEIIGGPANFGTFADFLLEKTATRALDMEVPYDFDVRVAFLKLESPYVLPFPLVRERIAADLNAGALIAAYVGHGAPTSFAHVRQGYRYYAVGSTEDAEALRIPEGKPFFISITCSTGEFDLADERRSLAEGMIVNPEGPIAVFAASRESHPYPNALYGEAFVEVFLRGRAASIGEGVIDVKARMKAGQIPLAPLLFDNDPDALAEEHEGLYNLFGDPATRLRYAPRATMTVTVAGANEGVDPGSTVAVAVEAPQIAEGAAELTLETRRTVIRGALIPPDQIRAMSEADAVAAVDRNYATASDKVVARWKQRATGGRAAFEVVAPKDPGEYALKVHVAGGGEAAVGSAKLVVRGPAGPAASEGLRPYAPVGRYPAEPAPSGSNFLPELVSSWSVRD